MKKSAEQEKLFMKIQKVSFAMDDLRLYLDTHPCCEKGLEYFQKLKEMREKALKEYTKMYGPLVAYDVAECDVWQWNDGPMPWQLGGC